VLPPQPQLPRIDVGKKIWKSHAFQSKLSEFCAVSGEAFCLLIVENNYERWAGMVKSGDFADKKNTAPKPLYTNAGKISRETGTAKAFQGWTMEGYQRFDELYNAVKADRVSGGRVYYQETLKSLVAQDNTKERPTRMVEDGGDGEVIYPAHDFDDVVTGGLNLLASSAHDAKNSEEEEEHSNSEGENVNYCHLAPPIEMELQHPRQKPNHTSKT
jgi:hypothetical protein